MQVYLAGVAPWRNEGGYDESIVKYRPYILESFYYVDKDTERLLPYYGDFLLDSGAFTFMMNAKTAVDWDEYIERYADFIVRNNVQKYFELDIDSIVGYETVKKYRKRLETITGRQSIPVWHNTRGIDEFKRCAAEYPYVALGGLVSGSGEYSRQLWHLFPWFIKTAHENGAKIHALGFTSIDGIKKYHFDSVDSSSWTSGNRYGHAFRFTGDSIRIVDKPAGARVGDSKRLAYHNFLEWIKFQRYADKKL